MSDKSSMLLRKQMVDDRIGTIAELLGVEKDKAFLRYVYAIMFGTRYDDSNIESDIVDGGDDKQFDIVRIEEEPDQATIYLVQVKNSQKFSGTSVVRMRDGLDWMFRKPESKYKALPNTDLAAKIGEIRHLIGGHFGHHKLNVRVTYAAKGDTSRLSPDFRREILETAEAYQGEFGAFSFDVLGINELIEREYEIEETKRKITADLPIKWDINVRSFMEFQAGDVRAAICSVQGTSLAQLVMQYPRAIFEENVRTFLGLGKSKRINQEIARTSVDQEQAPFFWFYNNGITVTCDRFDVVYSAKVPFIRLEGVQIVNGCQTSMALVHASQEGKLLPSVFLMLKAFETTDPAFVDKITLTTNSQNAVSSRDLRSNDMRQRDLAKLLRQRGYYFERKPREFNDLDLARAERRRIIPNEKAGQAHLAVVQGKPATAMAHKDIIWSDSYDDIFGSRVEEILAAYLFYDYCVTKHKQLLRKGSIGIEGIVAKYGHFHAARLIAIYELGKNWRARTSEDLVQFIERVSVNSNFLDAHYDKALANLVEIVERLTSGDLSRVINVFKSAKIEDELDNVITWPPSQDA